MSLDPCPDNDTLLRMAEERRMAVERHYERLRIGIPSIVTYLAPIALPADARRADVLEKREQAVITKMARVLGFHVYNLSQARRTKQTPGLPDLWLAHEGKQFAGWFEAKRQVGGTRSSAQLDFACECFVAGIPYGFGDRYAFSAFLSLHGFIPPPVPL